MISTRRLVSPNCRESHLGAPRSLRRQRTQYSAWARASWSFCFGCLLELVPVAGWGLRPRWCVDSLLDMRKKILSMLWIDDVTHIVSNLLRRRVRLLFVDSYPQSIHKPSTNSIHKLKSVCFTILWVCGWLRANERVLRPPI